MREGDALPIQTVHRFCWTCCLSGLSSCDRSDWEGVKRIGCKKEKWKKTDRPAEKMNQRKREEKWKKNKWLKRSEKNQGRWIRGCFFFFRRVWKEWSGREMTEEEKAACLYDSFYQSFSEKLQSVLLQSSYSGCTVKGESSQMGIIEKTCFLGSVLIGPWCKVFGEIKGIPQFKLSVLHVLMSYLVKYWLMEVRGLQERGRARLNVGVQVLNSLFLMTNCRDI